MLKNKENNGSAIYLKKTKGNIGGNSVISNSIAGGGKITN